MTFQSSAAALAGGGFFGADCSEHPASAPKTIAAPRTCPAANFESFYSDNSPQSASNLFVGLKLI